MMRVSILVLIVTFVASLVFGAPPSNAPRLTEVSKFPAEYESAVRAVIAAITKEGMKPSEYFAEISRRESTIHFWLIHESHDPDPGWRGDSCGKCRTIDYDVRSGSLSRIFGIR